MATLMTTSPALRVSVLAEERYLAQPQPTAAVAPLITALAITLVT